MSTNRSNVIVLMIVIAFLAESRNAQMDDYSAFNQDIPQNTAQMYCGEELADTLDTVCQGKFNSPYDNQEMEMADYPFAHDSPPFLPRARARRMLNGPFAGRRYRREWRGVHEECCLKACTINELSSYCEAP